VQRLRLRIGFSIEKGTVQSKWAGIYYLNSYAKDEVQLEDPPILQFYLELRSLYRYKKMQTIYPHHKLEF